MFKYLQPPNYQKGVVIVIVDTVAWSCIIIVVEKQLLWLKEKCQGQKETEKLYFDTNGHWLTKQSHI